MIQEKSFEDLGLPADFGYLYLHDGVPLVQLQPLPQSVLIFWRGSTNLSLLEWYFSQVVADMSKILNVPLFKLSRAVVHYGTPRGIKSFPYNPTPELAEESDIIGHHASFKRENLRDITFARFDVDYDQPITLWADLSSSKNAEVGFCSVVIPDVVTSFFAETCFKRVNERDLATLFEKMGLYMPMQLAGI